MISFVAPVWNKSQGKARNGRCKLHGCLSTSSKADAGRDMMPLEQATGRKG